jgi:hypothetical protein
VFREDGNGEWQQVGGFTDAPNAFAAHPAPAGNGRFTIPKSWATARTLSWYSNGVVAIDLSDPTQPARVGQFVPDTSNRHANSFEVGPAEVWGVAVDPTGVVNASHMRTGLWILSPIGPASPAR